MYKNLESHPPVVVSGPPDFPSLASVFGTVITSTAIDFGNYDNESCPSFMFFSRIPNGPIRWVSPQLDLLWSMNCDLFRASHISNIPGP
jgi:hypothetical protein